MKKIRNIIIMFMLVSSAFMLMTSTSVLAGDVYQTSGSPANSTTHYVNDNITISITLVTKTGANLNQNFTTNVTGTWTTIGMNLHGNNATVTDTLTGFATHNKKYFWATNTSNGNSTHEWDNNTYFFYTRSHDKPPATGSGSSSPSDTGTSLSTLDTTGTSDTDATIDVQADKIIISIIVFFVAFLVIPHIPLPYIKTYNIYVSAILGVLYYLFG